MTTEAWATGPVSGGFVTITTGEALSERDKDAGHSAQSGQTVQVSRSESCACRRPTAPDDRQGTLPEMPQ